MSKDNSRACDSAFCVGHRVEVRAVDQILAFCSNNK